jgi:hypothetical protein
MSTNIGEVLSLLKELNLKISKLDDKFSKLDDMNEKINTLMLMLQAMEIKQAEDVGGTRNVKITAGVVEEKEKEEEKEEPKKKSIKKVTIKKIEDVKSINKLEFFKKMFIENNSYFDDLLGDNKADIDRENADSWADLDETKLVKEKIKTYYNYIKNDANLDNQLQNMKHGYIAELKKSSIRLNKTEDH